MGTACICYKQQKPAYNIRPLDLKDIDVEQSIGLVEGRGIKNFVDIKNQLQLEQEQSQMNLNLINNELERYLVQFEVKNGMITNRFTQRLWQQNIKQGDNTWNIEQNKQNMINYSKQNELYLPLTTHNMVNQIEPSSWTQNQMIQQGNKSCLLSISSKILNQSLFTPRISMKKQFYAKYNNIGLVRLQQWNDNNRLTLQFESSQIIELQSKQIDQKFIILLTTFNQFWQNHFIHLLTYSQKPHGLKIYINGDQKLFPLVSTPKLIQVYNQIIKNYMNNIDICQLIYFLSGWMPQMLYFSQIKSFTGILERLAANLNEGNTLVTFTRQNKIGCEYASLNKVDLEQELIYLNYNPKNSTIPALFVESYNPENNVTAIKFQNFIELYDVINLNWNPFIYDLNQTCEAVIHISELKKFLLVIPPSSQDLEIRLFFQRHSDIQNIQKLGIIIKLFEYDGGSDSIGVEPIRVLQTQQIIYSDVFIFQYCKQKSQYLLVVSVNEEYYQQPIYFSLSLYSFAEMKFKELQTKPCLSQITLKTFISQDNIGYGINSPYFDKNLQFSIQVEIGNQLQIDVSSKYAVYQICVIPDPSVEKNLTNLKLENIINNSQISGEKQGNGNFVVKTAFKNYLLLLNTYQCQKQQIQITLRLFGKNYSNTNSYRLTIHQIKDQFQLMFTQDVKWLPNNSGPRKRLKSNSINSFQSIQIFQEFFKNPFIDKQLSKGKYQFFIKNQTFRDYFDSVETNEDKNSCEPPALSMAIFLASDNKQSYRIIIDDAFYVPFGVGFWTSSLELQQGTYRFVFPKMQKGFSKGIFGIIKH